MTLSEIYQTILNQTNTLTGKAYVLDRAPQKNFSDGFRGVYRYLRPAGVTKERRSQGSPETTIEVEVGILQVGSKEADIAAAENELDALLNSLLRTAQIADNLLVYASSTSPTNEQYLNTDGLDAEVPIIEATATISIRGYY